MKKKKKKKKKKKEFNFFKPPTMINSVKWYLGMHMMTIMWLSPALWLFAPVVTLIPASHRPFFCVTLRIMYIASDTPDLILSDKIDAGELKKKVCLYMGTHGGL